MDPIQNALASLLNALQAASAAPAPDVAAPQLPALLALVGQDVNMLFLGTGPDGQQLALPSGQVFTAQGGLPYPDGTELLVRMLGGAPAGAPAGAAESGSLRLQILEARPPAPAPILAPLLQGEGAALLGRLGRPDPGPGLAPLAALYESLRTPPAPSAPALPETAGVPPGPGAPPAATPPAPGAPPAATPLGPGALPLATLPANLAPTGPAAPTAAFGLPNALQIQAALDRLPAPVAATLKAILPADGSTAAALEAWLTEASAATPPGRPVLADLLQRFQALVDRHPELPPAPAAALQPFLKALVGPERERRTAAPPEPAPRPQGPSPSLLAAARSGPELPETWQSWIRAAVRTLSDPAASPREAPFHAAQAKEGTAFYELPLPWAPQTPLQVWVEADRKGKEGGRQDETRTVLVGLKFTRLGETRLGVAKGPAGLQVRVWTEHPELLASATEAMEKELGALGPAVDLKILPLRPGPGGFVPSLRSLVTGPTMQMLG